MKYYKIIQDKSFIGVVRSGQFVSESTDNHRLFYTDELHGQYVNYNEILYRDYWMIPLISNKYSYQNAEIQEITEEEYLSILQTIQNNEEIIIEEPIEEEEEEIIPEPENPDETLEYVRAQKLSEMSKTCRNVIEGGFDLELRGEIHHFSLDTQDQLNLISLSAMAQTQSMIPYHADGEMCIFYTAEEMNDIVATATAFKVYHTTYYNALKGYINALDTIEDIAAITYGTPIPNEYQSDVLRALEA